MHVDCVKPNLFQSHNSCLLIELKIFCVSYLMIVFNIKQYDITTPSLMIFKYYSASSGTAVGDPRGFIRSSPKCGPARVGVECPCQVSRVTRDT